MQLPALIVAAGRTRSMSRRQKLYGGSLFDSMVHFICGQEDDYFTRYKATLIYDHREGCSGNVVRDVKDYVEVGIAKREIKHLHFSTRTFNCPYDIGAAARTALAGKTLESIRSVTPFNEIFRHDLCPFQSNYRYARINSPALAKARRPASSCAFQRCHACIICGQISSLTLTSAAPAAAAKRVASASKVSADPICMRHGGKPRKSANNGETFGSVRLTAAGT